MLSETTVFIIISVTTALVLNIYQEKSVCFLSSDNIPI